MPWSNISVRPHGLRCCSRCNRPVSPRNNRLPRSRPFPSCHSCTFLLADYDNACWVLDNHYRRLSRHIPLDRRIFMLLDEFDRLRNDRDFWRSLHYDSLSSIDRRRQSFFP